jgi:hypothetical protein
MERKVYPPGAGDVTLELGGNTMVLRATLNAGLTVSRTAGGIRGAIDKVMQMDFDVIATVIRAGLGQKEAKKYNVEQMLYENGLMDSQGAVLSKVVEYLTNLARGGRPADDETEKEEDTEGREPLNPSR